MEYLDNIGKSAKSAAKVLAIASPETKDNALRAIAQALVDNSEEIINCNKTDLANGKENGLSDAMLDRLMLDKGRIEKIASSILPRHRSLLYPFSLPYHTQRIDTKGAKRTTCSKHIRLQLCPPDANKNP
jgi:hypothetical protein